MVSKSNDDWAKPSSGVVLEKNLTTSIEAARSRSADVFQLAQSVRAKLFGDALPEGAKTAKVSPPGTVDSNISYIEDIQDDLDGIATLLHRIMERI